MHYLELRCRACSWRDLCGPEAVAAWLRKAKKLRAGRQPEQEILYEVFCATAGQLACPKCGAVGLVASPAPDDRADWPEARLCESCSKPIPKERLQALPGATRCAACQRDEEVGRASGEAEYCPRCGALMELRLSRSGGLTRYAMACTANPPCRL
jgi:hypothetical protein